MQPHCMTARTAHAIASRTAPTVPARSKGFDIRVSWTYDDSPDWSWAGEFCHARTPDSIPRERIASDSGPERGEWEAA